MYLRRSRGCLSGPQPQRGRLARRPELGVAGLGTEPDPTDLGCDEEGITGRRPSRQSSLSPVATAQCLVSGLCFLRLRSWHPAEQRPALWLELAQSVTTVHVGVYTCAFATTVHRQRCRLGKEGLAGFRRKHQGQALHLIPAETWTAEGMQLCV